METVSVALKTEYIKLEALLQAAHAVSSGGEAKVLIQQGSVQVNGTQCVQRGRKLRSGDYATLPGREIHVT